MLRAAGAVLGPLVVGVLALSGGDYGPALGVPVVPGVAVLIMLACCVCGHRTQPATKRHRARRFGSGTLAGVAYAYSVPALIITTIAIQAAAVLLLAATRMPRRKRSGSGRHQGIVDDEDALIASV